MEKNIYRSDGLTRNKTPPWKQRLEKQTDLLRVKIGQREQFKIRNRSPKLIKRIRQIKNYNIENNRQDPLAAYDKLQIQQIAWKINKK